MSTVFNPFVYIGNYMFVFELTIISFDPEITVVLSVSSNLIRLKIYRE